MKKTNACHQRPQSTRRLWPAAALVTSLVLTICATSGGAGAEERFQCEPITIPMCQGIGYNLTYMPNPFNHETQSEAGLVVHQFWPLVKIKCSQDLQFFLCSLYAPICMENYQYHLTVCRSVCERARQGCQPVLSRLGFRWPEFMDCERFPKMGDTMCMDDNNTERVTSPPIMPLPPSTGDREREKAKKSKTNDMVKTLGQNIPGIHLNPGGVRPLPNTRPRPTTDGGKECKCTCEAPLISLSESSSSYYNKIRTGGVPHCALNCYTPYFTEHERTWATFWVGLWSILCCISTFMTVATFFVDMKRFKYPERPIIFLSACYFMVSVGYLIRFVVGHKTVACEASNDMIRYETTGPAVCTVVFLLVYFFGMASSIWWVILSFTWFLAAGLKWGQEAIASYSQYFHLAAWLIPSVKSIAVLAMSSVDGDPVAGICYVGNQNLDNLRGFVLAPLFVYLIMGMSFLLAGFVSLFRIRNVIKQQQGNGGKTSKLERLMIRIGVFSVLYTVPASIVIACYFYEQHLRERWERSHTCHQCLVQQMGGGGVGGAQVVGGGGGGVVSSSGDGDGVGGSASPGAEVERDRPNYSVFMLKYFMCLVIGTTSGFWIWSGKTVDSWRQLFHNLKCHRSNYPSRKYTNASYQPAKQLPLSHV